MDTTFRIAEVARRSGFTRATLRYDEELGLIEPTGRTESGYRLYDDASLERLRFIARAKQRSAAGRVAGPPGIDAAA